MKDASTQLAVLLFTDVVGSVELKTRAGARSYERLLKRHDALFTDVLRQAPSAEILNDMGDGFLTRFATPADAVLAALRFQRLLKIEAWEGHVIQVRAGLDIGQISLLKEGERTRIVGLPADTAARLMGLAQPGQILLTRTVFENARQYLRSFDDEPDRAAEIRWVAYGYYAFKGLQDPLEVFEVGLPGVNPLSAPPDSDKAVRVSTAGGDPDWRPAGEQEVPGRRGWILKRKLGEGGFGEVWLARHKRTSDERVFKFCFDDQKLDSLRREAALFRLIRDKLGSRSDISRLHELEIDHPPFFLECEYSEQGSLLDWVKQQGGLERIAMPQRVDLVARVARAAHAAHSVGILHKDIKPANILIYCTEDGQPRPKLGDFGIGEVTERAAQTGVHTVGWATTIGSSSGARYSGTQMYTPPEVQAGERFTVRGDVYALGVLLYQLAAGDLQRPMGQGWERYISDKRLAGIIADCIDLDPQQRIPSAETLAEKLELFVGSGVPGTRPAAGGNGARAAAAPTSREAPTPRAGQTPSGSRGGKTAIAIGATVVIAALGVAMILYSRSTPPDHPPRPEANQAPLAVGPAQPADPPTVRPQPASTAPTATQVAQREPGPNAAPAGAAATQAAAREPNAARPDAPADPRATIAAACDAADALLARKEFAAARERYGEALAAAQDTGVAEHERLLLRIQVGQAICRFRIEGKPAGQESADLLRYSYARLKRELGDVEIVRQSQGAIIDALLVLGAIDEAGRWNDQPDIEAKRFDRP